MTKQISTDQSSNDQISNNQPIDVYGQTAQNTVKAEHDGSTSFPAQQNYGLTAMNPSSKTPSH